MTAFALHGFNVSCPAGMDEQKFVEIMSEDMSDVRAHLRDHDGMAMSYLKRLEVEWKKYLVLLFMHPGKEFVLTKPVDYMGHAHTVFTRPFKAFCSKVMSGFVHHTPTKSQDERNALKPAFLADTVPSMENAFGEVDSDVWDVEETVCKYSVEPA